MHWVLQENLWQERGWDTLVDVLRRAELPHSFHKVVPFVGELAPDISPEGPVIVMGAYSLRHVARRKGWIPGSFDLADVTYADHVARWGAHMLNADAVTCTFADVPRHIGSEPFFLRPTVDSKFFAGTVTTRDEFLPWHARVVALGEDDGSSLRASTDVLVSSPKHLLREYRLWIVDGEVATASLYRQGSRSLARPEVEPDVLAFGRARAREWSPQRAFVLDVALVEDGLRVIETNTLNASGFYAADVARLVEALESMRFP